MPRQLGQPDEYEAFVVDSLTQETIDLIPWSSIEWQRTRNGVSRATVRCAKQLGIRPKWFDIAPLQAWSRMIVIMRNGFRVWDGPIRGWSPDGGLTISAVDRSILLGKYFLAADIDLTASLLNSLYGDLLYPAMLTSGMLTAGVGAAPFTLSPIPDAYADETTLNGVFDVDVTGAWRFNTLLSMQALFEEMGRSAFLCWTQDREDLNMFIDRMPLRFTLRPEYIISETGDIGVSCDAEDLATAVYKGDTGQGIAGFPNSVVGDDIQLYVPYALYGALPDAQTSPVTWYSGDSFRVVDPQQYISAAPTITLEEVTLSPDCYVDDADYLTDLMPGSLMSLDFPNSWSLNTPIASARPDYGVSANQIESAYAERIQYARMEQVDVRVDRTETTMNETVRLSMTAWATS